MKTNLKTLNSIADTVLAYRPVPKAHKPNGKKELFTLELCAGGGGSALGIEQAGFTHTALVENNHHACATLRSNRPYWNVIEADMTRFDASYWRGVDLLSGGLPCPPFSIAGKQLGEDDDRDMFPSMLRIVREVQPRAVLIENVRGILASRFDEFRAKIDNAFDAQGFDTYWHGYNAADFGVPQTRYRAFLVALKRGVTKPLVWPTPMKSAPISVGDTIVDLMASRGWRGAEAWKEKAIAPAPTIVGGSYKHGGPDLGPTRARREWAELGVDGLGLADAPPEPKFSGMPRLTVPMVARLQSFPDDWKFAGGKTQSYRQVGNALPVKLAFTVAKAVRQCLA
jgi:DNA (cytosine-5)-methyltransferase 1